MPELAATTYVWRDLSGSDEEVYREDLALIRSGWLAAEKEMEQKEEDRAKHPM